MNYSGVNNEQFIIMPGGTESAAVQTHETFYIAPITHITHLSDLHLNHRGEQMEVKCAFFKTLIWGFTWNYTFGFKLNTRQCNCSQRGHLRWLQPCGRRLSLLWSESQNLLEKHIQLKTIEVQTNHFQRRLSSIVYLPCVLPFKETLFPHKTVLEHNFIVGDYKSQNVTKKKELERHLATFGMWERKTFMLFFNGGMNI